MLADLRENKPTPTESSALVRGLTTSHLSGRSTYHLR